MQAATARHIATPSRLPVAACPCCCSWPWPGGDAPAASLAEQADAAKAAAADVLAALMAQPSHGPRVSLLMGKLLPPGLVASIAEGPPAAVLRALGQVGGHVWCWLTRTAVGLQNPSAALWDCMGICAFLRRAC